MDVPTAMSICTGYDGIGLGLKMVIPNLRTICYLERETYPVANLVAKIRAGKLDDAPIWDDIATFDGRPFEGLVDIFHGGIPCQPWSCAGKQKGIEDERWIWDDVFRIIKEIKPRYIFLEEVPGFVSGGGLGFVLSDLAEERYDAEWGLFSAAEVGAPHKRQRLFILAHSLCQRNRAGLGEVQEADGEIPQRHNDAESKQSGELADAGGDRPQRVGPDGRRQGQVGLCNRAEFEQRWPARPGEPQYDWEEPRTIERGLCKLLDGTPSLLDKFILDITKTPLYNAVLGVKDYEGIIKTLWLLSKEVGTEAIQWQVGRFWYFFSQEVLRLEMLRKKKAERGCNEIRPIEASEQVSEETMSEVRVKETASNTSHEQQYQGQLERELNDLVRILSYKMALGEWEKAIDKIKANLLCVRENMPYSPWNVSCSLSESEEVWRSASNKEVGQWVLGAYQRYINWQESLKKAPIRVDELRALGNGVVPQTAAKAWITLWEQMK